MQEQSVENTLIITIEGGLVREVRCPAFMLYGGEPISIYVKDYDVTDGDYAKDRDGRDCAVFDADVSTIDNDDLEELDDIQRQVDKAYEAEVAERNFEEWKQGLITGQEVNTK